MNTNTNTNNDSNMNTPETATAAEAAVTTAEIASVATAETAAKAAAEISAKTDPQHASMPALKEHILPNLRIFGFILLGSLLYSLGLNLFYRPSQLLSGGLTGIAMLLNYQFGFSTSLMVILLNIPMFILGFFLISRRFVLESLVGMLIFTGSIELFKNLSLPFNSPVTAIVLGGFLTGLGNGCIFRSGASVGGTDIISKTFHKYFSVNMATTALVINCVIVLVSAFIYGIDQAVLTVCAMFIASKVTTYVIDGIDHRRAILIVTEKKDTVAKALMEKLGRGITILDAHGAYTGNPNSILYCVISKHQLQTLKLIIKKEDPNAFFTIITVNGVYGHGHSFFQLSEIES